MNSEEKDTLKNVINQIRVIKGENIPYKDFAEALSIQTASVNKRLARNYCVNQNDIELLKKYFGIQDLHTKGENLQIVEINYYQNEKLSKLIQNPLISKFYLDYELVTKMWRILPENLKLISMPGDKMETIPSNHLHIRNRDVLLMDISSIDINISGIYAYETLGGTKLQISNVAVMTNSNVRFYYANSLYPDEVRTEKDLKSLDFRVIGRIIKNLSFIHS